MKRISPLIALALVLVLTGARCSNPFSIQPQAPEVNEEKTQLQKELQEAGIYETVTAPEGEGVGAPEARLYVDLSGEFTATPQEPKSVVVNLEMNNFTFTPNVITVNQGDTIELSATSVDVGHGFIIEGYNISAQPRVGETVTQEFVADKVGTFTIRCTVYCGDGHKEMTATLIVL